jgi:hypothetical protein
VKKACNKILSSNSFTRAINISRVKQSLERVDRKLTASPKLSSSITWPENSLLDHRIRSPPEA